MTSRAGAHRLRHRAVRGRRPVGRGAQRLAARRLVLLVATVFLIAACSTGTSTDQRPDTAQPAVTVPEEVAGCESFVADGQSVSGDGGVPAVRLPCLAEGPDVTLDDLGARPVLVNLWASWCAPCRKEMPLLQQAYERFGDRVGFLGVNTADSRSAAVSLIADLGVTYAHVVDSDKEVLTELAVPGLPVTLAVAPDGRILDRQIGELSEARLEELVNGLAASAPAP